jgi:hypothetical protein
MKRLFAPMIILCAVALVQPTSGCGIFDSASTGIEIDVPEQTFPFDIDLSDIRGELQEVVNEQIRDTGQTLDISGLEELPEEVAGYSLTVQHTFELELPAEQVDVSNDPDLKKYIEAGKVKEVTIKYVRASFTTNTLNFDTPEIDLYMDDHGTTQIAATSVKVAIIPVIQAGSTASVDLEFTPNGRQTMSDYILSYKFAVMAKLTVTIDTSVTRTIPTGILAGQVELGLRFTVDPL